MNFKIVLVGDGAVGKTALRRKYMGKGFEATYLTTLGADFSIKTTKITDEKHNAREIKLQIWDLAGQQTFENVRPMYYKGVNAVIFVYDIARLSSFENIYNWVGEIKKYALDYLKTAFLLANKIDLRRAGENVITTNDGKKLAENLSKEEFEGVANVHFSETSAKTGENVNEVFTKIAEDLYQKNPKNL